MALLQEDRDRLEAELTTHARRETHAVQELDDLNSSLQVSHVHVAQCRTHGDKASHVKCVVSAQVQCGVLDRISVQLLGSCTRPNIYVQTFVWSVHTICRQLTPHFTVERIVENWLLCA